MNKSTIFYLICLPILAFPVSLLAEEIQPKTDVKQSFSVGDNQIKHNKSKKKTEVIGLNDSVDMTVKHRQELMNRANDGDGGAANALGMYYDIIKSDMGNAIYWLRKGAENGSAIAQYNLANVLLRRKNSRTNREEAIHWLEVSEQKGIIAAKSVLERLKREDMKNAISTEKTSTP